MHRPQNDPQIHDASSSSMVFQELAPKQAHKIKTRDDLESELFGGSTGDGDEDLPLRDNEGQAAEYGIYYDDTEYDYMQHMRDLNGGGGIGESYFVEAPIKVQKGKDKISLEDALRNASLEDAKDESSISRTSSQLLDDSVLPSKTLRKTTYQDQQDIPDVLAGFQPDMDPRLREVLEALEDEAYVDDEEELFGELAKDREELSLAAFEQLEPDGNADTEEDTGWESDDTAKPNNEYNNQSHAMSSSPVTDSMATNGNADHVGGDWMAEFSKFKKATKAAKNFKPAEVSNAELQSSIVSGSSMGGRKKKRKGAMTSSTGYSMTSSSLLRTEGLTTLDARFDKIEQEYAEDDDMEGDDDDGASVATGRMSNASGLSNLSKVSGLSRLSTTSSQAPDLVMRSDFDGIMDEFLGSYSMSGKKRVKKGRYQSGLEQLDEIRRELGPPIIATQKVGR